MLVNKFAKLQHLIGYRLWLKFWPKNISNIIDYVILLFEEWNQLVIREIFRRWVEVSVGSHWAWGQKPSGVTLASMKEMHEWKTLLDHVWWQKWNTAIHLATCQELGHATICPSLNTLILDFPSISISTFLYWIIF